jgi:hypothetical protein
VGFSIGKQGQATHVFGEDSSQILVIKTSELTNICFNCFDRLVCKGFIHQGDIESAGRQCTWIALVFLTSNIIPKSECEIDNFLQKGTSLYHILCSHDGFMLVTEFPELVHIDNEDLNFKVKDHRSGMLSQETWRSWFFDIYVRICSRTVFCCNIGTLSMPRRCARQTQRHNIPQVVTRNTLSVQYVCLFLMPWFNN